VARRRLGFWRRFAVLTIKPVLQVMTVRDWRGTEHIPRTGGFLLVANHISHADPLISGHFLYDAGRWPRFLAKSSLFKLPVIGPFLRAVGQIPVHRGTVDAARALEVAVEAVRSGHGVIIYPEGTTTREPDLWPMQGKTGAARLWLATGVPVVPLVMWGPERIFDPRTQRLKLLGRTRVTVVAGPPVDLSKWSGAPVTSRTLTEITDAIMLHLRDMLVGIRGGTPPPLWGRGGASTVEDTTTGGPV
jgi:1-acyl-sn-glycerol-3-phosphate acyltransferase